MICQAAFHRRGHPQRPVLTSLFAAMAGTYLGLVAWRLFGPEVL